MNGTRRVSMLAAVAMVGGMVAATIPALPAAAAVTVADIQTNFIPGGSQPFGVAVVSVDSTHVYWGNAGTDKIGRADLDGTNADESFIDAKVTPGGGQEATNGVAVRGSHLYWSNQFTGTIGRATLNGDGAATNLINPFISGGSQTTRVVVTATHIYWANNGNNTIGRADLTGTGDLIPGSVNQAFILTGAGPVGLAVDANFIYWANQNAPDQSIGRANLADGSGVNNSFIASAAGVSTPAGVAVDSGHIYWANHAAGTISVADLDGTNVSVLIGSGNTSSPRGVAVDNGYIYWANNSSGSIGRATFVDVPGAPTGVSAVAGNGQGTVTFTPPVNDGGSNIQSYTVTCTSPTGTSPVIYTPPMTPTTIIVTGLTNGATYTCTVKATNLTGTGPPSAPSNAFVPLGSPGAPTGVTAVAGNGQGTVSFTPPTDNGGSTITSYTTTCTSLTGNSPVSVTPMGVPTTVVVTGLTNGATYTCSVAATNAVGTGPATASNTFVPATLPAAPTIGPAATAGPNAISVSFTPGSNGGSAIQNFTATCVSLSGVPPIAATGAGSPIIVTGLAGNTPYSCSVTATNAVGTGPPSGSSNVIITLSVLIPGGAPTPVAGGCAAAPSAPRTPSATSEAVPGAAVSWAPALTGCIAGYIVTPYLNGVAQPPTLVPGVGTTTVIRGLVNGKTYTFTVAAENGVIVGPASVMTAPVTIGAPAAAGAVKITKVGRGSLKVSFVAARSNGAPIKSYTATCVSSNRGTTRTKAGRTSPITVTGLTAGRVYTCTVKATNSRGTGPSSRTSAAVKV